MERAIPWPALARLVEPHWLPAFAGQSHVATETLVRIHCMQLWLGLRDSDMAQELRDVPLYMEFAGLASRVPDEDALREFRRVLQRHHLSGDLQRVIREQLKLRGLTLRPGTTVEPELASASSMSGAADGESGSRAPKAAQGYFGI